MTIATTSSTVRRSLLQHIPELALALAGTAVVLLALGPIGWRAGWWHFRFSLLTLMPWAAYFGLAAVIVAVLALVIGLSRLDWRGIALALVALIPAGKTYCSSWLRRSNGRIPNGSARCRRCTSANHPSGF